ncbi:Blp family class II bacteriocin [Streptococcus mutans]|nr:Blp family class II bacteriocin [Streptococcus mutans]MCB5122715.1 Blp family class II bacteriocin [Streptococcus mutans]
MDYKSLTEDELSQIEGGKSGIFKAAGYCAGDALLGVWGGPAGMAAGCAVGVVESFF